MLKDRIFWYAVALTVILLVLLMPYSMYADMYIADAFALLCTMLTLFSAPVFGVVFYLWRKKTLFGEYFSSMIALLVFCGIFHGIFAVMSWGSCVFAAASAVLVAAMFLGKYIRKT